METVKVSTVSEAIRALQEIHAQHGDLQMLNEEGGPYQFSTTVWSEEIRLAEGVDREELPDGVSIHGVCVVRDSLANGKGEECHE